MKLWPLICILFKYECSIEVLSFTSQTLQESLLSGWFEGLSIGRGSPACASSGEEGVQLEHPPWTFPLRSPKWECPACQEISYPSYRDSMSKKMLNKYIQSLSRRNKRTTASTYTAVDQTSSGRISMSTTTSAPPTRRPNLSEDEIDDLLYFARTGGLEEFNGLWNALCEREKVDFGGLLELAVDGQSGNGVIHMGAGNGHLGQYIQHSIISPFLHWSRPLSLPVSP